MFSYFCMNALCPWNKPCKLRVTRAISCKCDRSTPLICVRIRSGSVDNFVKNVRHVFLIQFLFNCSYISLQEILCICEPKVYYYVRKNPLLDPVIM